MDTEYARRYRQLYERHFWWRAREQLLLGTLQSLSFPRGGHVLDVGCGDGLFFSKLSRFGRVHGVEADPSLVSDDGPHRTAIHVGPFDDRYAPRERFALILMLDVLEHLDQPASALRHALSLLAEGGAIVITLPAFPLLWTHHDDLNHHRMRYTLASFDRLARDAGMRVDRRHYIFHLLFAAKLAGRLRERILGTTVQPAEVPPSALNRAAYVACRLEQRAFGRHPLPFGSSLLAVGGRPAEPA